MLKPCISSQITVILSCQIKPKYHRFTLKDIFAMEMTSQTNSKYLIIISLKQNKQLVMRMMSKQLTVPIFTLFYYSFVCFQEELEEIWKDL